MTRLERLKHDCGQGRIFKAFYDVEDRRYFKSWDELEEKTLESHIEKISEDYTKIMEVTDIRILCQILLDYIDQLQSPLISQDTIQKLEILAKKQHNGEDIDNPEEIRKVELTQVAQNKHQPICSS